MHPDVEVHPDVKMHPKVEMHPDVEMHLDKERHPNNEMHLDNAIDLIIGMHFIVGIHLDIGMHPEVKIHPDVSHSLNLFPPSWAGRLWLVSTYFIVVKCNEATNRIYQNIVPGSALGPSDNIGVIWPGTHTQSNSNVEELLRIN